jgi:iron complex transport system substrate-binding protein
MAAALVLAACGGGPEAREDSVAGSVGVATSARDGATSAGDTFPFEHSAGITEVPVDPQRIATTTDQNALLPLLELGVTPVASAGLVAEDGTRSFRRTDGFGTSGVEFLGAYGEPNFEAFAAADPDLIVGHEFDADHYDTWSDIAPTVLVQIFGRPLTDALTDFGTLVGREEQAAGFRADHEARIEELSTALEPVRDELSVSVITSGDPGQFWRADDGQAIGTVMADLDPPRAAVDGYFTSEEEPYSVETVAEHDADVVVVDFRGRRPGPGLRRPRRLPPLPAAGGVAGRAGTRRRRHDDGGGGVGEDGRLPRRARGGPPRRGPRHHRGRRGGAPGRLRKASRKRRRCEESLI